MTQKERVAHFRRLHENRPLVLPNAWDAASARVIELAGAPAIATTSAGVSWAHGRRDGHGLRRDEMIEAIRRIVEAVDVPVTADIEGGYGSGSVQDVAETVRAVVELGAVGINLEDASRDPATPLLAPEVQAERIHAARAEAAAAGGDLFINARTDVYLARVGEPQSRLAAAIERANVYLAAGADGVFVPGVTDADTIAALARAIDGPLNIMWKPGAPSVPDLARLGVARVSVGSAIALAALTATRHAARELLERGTYGAFEHGLSYGEVDGLFARA
ncbi:MAG TPA: isocitrate lyase/phosphoenolpyruvate mutase family protein [Longimicrobiales bacterium]